MVFKDLMNKVGCQVEYWNMKKKFPYCTKGKELEKVEMYLIEVFANNIDVVPPCKTIKQVQIDYKDVEYKVVVDFKNLNHHFKEIRQVQAYTSESLIGTEIKFGIIYPFSTNSFIGIYIHA